jgi:hypothetical protein
LPKAHGLLAHGEPVKPWERNRTNGMSDDGSVFDINKDYPLYLREPYKGNRAPIKKVQRYVSPVII